VAKDTLLIGGYREWSLKVFLSIIVTLLSHEPHLADVNADMASLNDVTLL